MEIKLTMGIGMNHLSGWQMEDLAMKLKERTRTLAAQVREECVAADTQHYRDLAGVVTDTADEALAHVLVDLDTTLIDRHVTELRDIEAAQKRIKEQTYGICLDCGDAVVYERLAAYPTAKRCLNCQKILEG